MSMLRDAESRYRAVFDAARDAMIVYTRDGLIVEANAAACRTYGYTREELIGVNARDSVHPDARPHFEEFLQVAGAGGEFRCETVDRRRDGAVFPIEVTGTQFTYAGQPHLMAVIRDITERKRAEEQLRRNHDTFYNLIQNNPFGVYVVDADFRLRQVSLGSQKVFAHVRPLLGRDFNEVLRIIWLEPFASEALARFRHTLETGEPYTAMRTVEQRRDVAEVEAYDWRIERIVLPDGRFGVVCYFYDLTERQQLEKALRQSEERLRAIFEQTQAGIAQVDLSGRFVLVNERYAQIVGRSREELQNLRMQDITHPEDLPRNLALFQQAVRDGTPFIIEKRYVRPDGSEIWVSNSVSVMRDREDRPSGVIAASVDVSDRRRAEVALRASEERFAAFMNNSPTASWITDANGRVEYVSGTYVKTFALPTADLIGKRPLELYSPEFAEQYVANIRAVAESGRAVEVEESAPRPDGSVGEFLVYKFPLRDSTGRTLVGGVAVDVTERKRAQRERERLLAAEQAARAEAERASEAKSEFLATLSHELRTPLTPVLLTVSLMESHPHLPADLREDVAAIRRNIELESRLISDLLDLTRIVKGKLQLEQQDVDLHLIVRSALNICQREASAKLTLDLAARRHTVRGDSTRLQQVFWNLINNAIKFTPQGGAITVRSENTDDGHRVRVEVADTGAGIDAAVLPRLFNAFEQGEVRAARQQAGLGLGLAISRKLAEAHGGTITAASAGRGRGATFTVDLPVVDEIPSPAAAATPPERAASVATGGRPLAVLLVEDHEPTLRAVERLLRQIGHRVTGVTSVASATAAAAQNGFDVIISDLGLPDGSGLDLMRQVRDQYAGRAIALTGYGMESDLVASREAGFAEHLTKPVDLAALDAAIRRVSEPTR